jgi:hypothetical protein
MTAARAVVAVAVTCILIALAMSLTQGGVRTAGTNSVDPRDQVAVVAPHQQLCQDGEAVPPDAGALELNVAASGRPGPPVRVAVGADTSGVRAGGYDDGWLRVPLQGALADGRNFVEGVRVCVENQGRSPLALTGKGTTVALRWRRPGRESWFSLAPTIARRATFGKADFGPWTPLVLLGVVWVGSLALVLRRTPE